jgi:hypothetical protein
VLPAQDTAVIREWTKHSSPLVRKVAVEHLSWHGPAGWDDLHAWLLDPDKDVRYAVIGNVSDSYSHAISSLYTADKGRAIRLLSEAAERYADYSAVTQMRMLAGRDEEAFELVWAAGERILACDNIDATTAIVVGFFEDVISDRNMGPDDPHIKSWLGGDDWGRKVALLDIGRYLKLQHGRMREITTVLAGDRNGDIAAMAREVLKDNPVPVVPHKTGGKSAKKRSAR